MRITTIIIIYFITIGSYEKQDQFKVGRSYDNLCVNKIYEQPINPLKEVRFTSDFGPRYHPISKEWKFHKGIDMDANKGDTIFASLSGIIIQSKYTKGYGNVISIESERFIHKYAHMSKRFIDSGYVKQGQPIGLVGSTGLSTGSHLHLEFRYTYNRKLINGKCYFTETKIQDNYISKREVHYKKYRKSRSLQPTRDVDSIGIKKQTDDISKSNGSLSAKKQNGYRINKINRREFPIKLE